MIHPWEIPLCSGKIMEKRTASERYRSKSNIELNENTIHKGRRCLK